ncbi:hypothetical protein RB653_005905 [Dictyostelium firmibasis]|uniref:PA14 domain-containing protein n=1 Tax=Dictyostelium firmibasis TaxID=79012 RepID=A0AAN7U8U8_9MYCE
MKVKFILKNLLLVVMVSLVYAQKISFPETITLNAVIYDQHMFYNDNFENQGSSQLTIDMVMKKLDSKTKIPQLVSDDTSAQSKNYLGTILRPSLFKYFFSENTSPASNAKNSGKNIPMPLNFTLKFNSKSSAYEFEQDEYFPINSKGFNDPDYPIPSNWVTPNHPTATDWFMMDGKVPANQKKNYNFCIKINSKFTYWGDEVFNFKGDDDVWVFINNQLVIDLGGLHSAASKNIILKNISPPLTIQETYDFDFFYCERKAQQSSIQISTNLQVFCINDYCGICNGDGSSCCPASYCDDQNACTIDKCPEPTKVQPGKLTKNDCIHTQIVCEKAKDKCERSFCDTLSGCKKENITCNSGNIDKCQEENGVCDPEKGCQYRYTCTDNGRCDLGCNGGKCEIKNQTYCEDELGNDPCYTYRCDIVLGCVRTPKCSQEGLQKCQINFCHSKATSETDRCELQSIKEECDCCENDNITNCQLPGCSSTGTCEPKDKMIDDGNLCTFDECHENGTITHTPKQCGGCSQCDVKTGFCIENPPVCDDGNICTKDKCTLKNNTDGSFDGLCSNDFIACGLNDTDKCNIWSCDPEKGGCQSNKVVCEEISLCKVGKCQPSTGKCEYKDRVCDHGGAFCLISQCDERLGCIVFERQCVSNDRKCKAGVCVNGTDSDSGECRSVNYDPLPFVCQTAAVISTAVIAGVTVAGAVALGVFLYGGKKGYDYWQENKSRGMTGASNNPMYKESENAGQNPLYRDNNL